MFKIIGIEPIRRGSFRPIIGVLVSSQSKPVVATHFVSIVIPSYNEARTLPILIPKIYESTIPFPFEVVVVDDGSTDRTPEILQNIKADLEKIGWRNFFVIRKDNGGKGSAVREGFTSAKGNVLLIQDADLEYDPFDYGALLAPFQYGDQNQVVFGSRYMLQDERPSRQLLSFYLGGKLITFFTNLFFQGNLNDACTGYKVFHRSVLENIEYSAEGFAWESQLTARLLKSKVQITEVPIHYEPRTRLEGKKITWLDGLKTFLVLVQERLRWKKRT